MCDPVRFPLDDNEMPQEIVSPDRRRLLVMASCAAVSSFWLTACGGGGTVPGLGVQLRPLSPEFSRRKAVAYSPFRTANRETETITTAMVKQDLTLLVDGGFKLIRLFDSSDSVAKLALQVIKDNSLDVKVMLGIHIASGNDTFNTAEVARGIALANAFPETVLAVSVGNETMVSWSFNKVAPDKMAGYIATVRNGVIQPVTTDDNWAFFATAPRAITDLIDFVAMHTYPLSDTVHAPDLWDWQQVAVSSAGRAMAMMDAAVVAAQKDFLAVRGYLDSVGQSAMPILIGETGWKAVASGGEVYRAHPVNQKMYLDHLQAWSAATNASTATSTGPLAIVYFEAFDEPWKFNDDGWGLFNVARQARFAVQQLYPNSLWAPGAYMLADAAYYIPLINNGAVTARRYTVYADTLSTGEARPTETPTWNAWENGTTGFSADQIDTAAPVDPGRSIQIMPNPAPWGWGMALTLRTTSDDLSNFATAGTLNFSIKTIYPGKLEVGFLTGSSPLGTAYDVYLVLSPGDYGYQNDDNWHEVSIPIRVITQYGAMSSGMTDALKAKLDMTKVTNPFVIADRFANTAKAQGGNITSPVQVDAIYWAR